MDRYDYMACLCEDIKAYIQQDEIDIHEDDIEETLHDCLWCEDSVTGNASGSYTFNAWRAEENLCHNLGLLAEACSEFGSDASKLLSGGAEACDVTIRCYLLSDAIARVIEELRKEED
jgi:hypothetical protein